MAQYETIYRTQYNEIQTVVARVLGKTESQITFGATGDDYGYGQTVSSTSVPENTLVTAQQWQALTYDLLRCLYHQTGTNNSGLFVSTENVNGVAVTSGYPYSTTVLTTATITSAIDNTITVDSITNMNIGMSIKFTTNTSPAPAFGGIVLGQTYYIFNIIIPVNPLDPKKIQISTVPPSSTTTAVVLTSNSSPNIQVEASGSKGQYILEKDRARLYEYGIEAPGTNLANIEKNRLNAFTSVGTYNPITNPSGSFTQMNVETYSSYIHSPTPWNGSFQKIFKFTFPGATSIERHKNARYFFNSGGRIRITPNYAPTGSAATGAGQIDSTWQTIVSNIGTLSLGARTVILSSGITNSATVTLFNQGQSGFYNLGEATTELVNSRAPSSNDYYNYISVTISALYDRGGILDMVVSYTDVTSSNLGSWGIEEVNNGTASIAPSVLYANGVDISGNITVQVPLPAVQQI